MKGYLVYCMFRLEDRRGYRETGTIYGPHPWGTAVVARKGKGQYLTLLLR